MTEAPATFHLFPDLPAEIRRKIWAAAVDHPRLIEPFLSRVDYRSDPPKPSYCCTIPILVQICQESRDEARLRYHRVPLPGGLHLGPPLYLNPSSDILFLSHDSSSRPLHGILGSFSLFNERLNARDASAWNSLRSIALCSSNAMRLIEPLCLRFPCLDTLFLLQAPEKLVDAHLLKRRIEEHLERRRDGRGDGKIPSGLVIEVVTLEGLRKSAGWWDGQMGGKAQSGSTLQCPTCLLQL